MHVRHRWSQLVSIPLPKVDLTKLAKCLLEDYKIEIPIFAFQDHTLMALSIRPTTRAKETDIIVNAIRSSCPSRIS